MTESLTGISRSSIGDWRLVQCVHGNQHVHVSFLQVQSSNDGCEATSAIDMRIDDRDHWIVEDLSPKTHDDDAIVTRLSACRVLAESDPPLQRRECLSPAGVSHHNHELILKYHSQPHIMRVRCVALVSYY